MLIINSIEGRKNDDDYLCSTTPRRGEKMKIIFFPGTVLLLTISLFSS